MNPAGVPLEELRFRLRGELYGPGDPGYREACAPFDAQAEGRPQLVARCSAPEDVVVALAFAREQGLTVGVLGGGHSPPGAARFDDGLAIDLRGLCEIEVDVERRVARVGGGASGAAVDRATRRRGLATTPWREGEPCEDLLAAQLVSAEGTIVRARAGENPEPLRALRAGGPVSGAITSLELRLHPPPLPER